MTAKLLSLLLAGWTQIVGGDLDRPAPAVPPGVATVQVDLLPDDESAERLAAEVRERLRAAGLALPVAVETIPAEPELPRSHRVVVGPFAEFEDAERARTALEAAGVPGFVREGDLGSPVVAGPAGGFTTGC